ALLTDGPRPLARGGRAADRARVLRGRARAGRARARRRGARERARGAYPTGLATTRSKAHTPGRAPSPAARGGRPVGSCHPALGRSRSEGRPASARRARVDGLEAVFRRGGATHVRGGESVPP